MEKGVGGSPRAGRARAEGEEDEGKPRRKETQRGEEVRRKGSWGAREEELAQQGPCKEKDSGVRRGTAHLGELTVNANRVARPSSSCPCIYLFPFVSNYTRASGEQGSVGLFTAMALRNPDVEQIQIKVC